MRGPRAAAAIVAAKFDVLRAPIRSVNLLLEIGTSLSWFDSVEDGAEKAVQWDPSFREHLRRELEASHQHGRPSRFGFNSSSDDYIQGSCFPEPGDTVTLRTAKERRAQYTSLEGFLASLTNREFEAVCKGILDLVGCAPAVLTRHANDQGIDFFGRLSLQGRLGQIYELSSIDRSMSAWLVGQAKHYSGRASTPELRELVGSVELARSRVFGDDGSALTGLTMRQFDPVFYLFFTTGTISRDGWKIIKEGGLVGLEGSAIAALLADHSIGVSDGKFDLIEAQAWVAAHSI